MKKTLRAGQIKAVVFDLGGVLEYDSRRQVNEHIARSFGMGVRRAEAALADLVPLLQTGKITEAQLWQRFSQKTGKTSSAENIFRMPHAKHFRILRGTLKLVRELRKNGFKLAVLSNTIPAHFRREHAQNTFKNFDFVALSYKTGLRKPDRRAYLNVLGKLRVAPRQALYIDNELKHVKAARATGMRAILFKNSGQLRRALEKMKLL